MMEAPPEVDISKNNIKRFKEYSALLYQKYQDLQAELDSSRQLVTKLQSQHGNLNDNISEKLDVISNLKLELDVTKRTGRALDETERILLIEKRIRQETEGKLADSRNELAVARQEFLEYKGTVLDNANRITQAEERISDLLELQASLEQTIQEKEFQNDAQKVEIIKFQRENDILSKSNADLKTKADFLVESSNALTTENQLLQKRIRDLLDANKEVTGNYQIMKKNFDIKKHESDEANMELEEAKNACTLALKQKKAIREELSTTLKSNVELEAKVKSLSDETQNQALTIDELLKRLTDIEVEYEEKIKRKEQQLWNASAQMKEEANKAEQERSRAIASANRKREEAAAIAAQVASATKGNGGGEAVSEAEKKWQKREKTLLKEIDEANDHLMDKHRMMSSMAAKMEKLEMEQYNPRMAYIQSMEINMKKKLIDLSISEERLETGFMCPRDLRLLESPTTLFPCNHTFCLDCVKDMREENFNSLKCSVCKQVADRSFHNDKIESLKQQFIKLKEETKIFGDWINKLESYNPLPRIPAAADSSSLNIATSQEENNKIH